MFAVAMRLLFHTACLLMIALPLGSATAAPLAYSVNSDQPLGDTLHVLDLADGTALPVGAGVSSFGGVRLDIEGLAMAPDLSLWAADDDSTRLFRINTATGLVIQESDVLITGLDSTIANDYGLTFTCDGTLLASSVVSQSLFSIDTSTGVATRIGAAGSLGVNISAIASHGAEPARIYGLGNGLLGDEGPQDTRSLYEISLLDGTTTLIGALGPAVADYAEAGLSFDTEGALWAITDRSQSGQPSEILQLNLETGLASVASTTTIIGFESLAIAPPGGCEPGTPQIPALDASGRRLAILALMLTGLFGLRQRLS
jgi:hypothetical protein